MKLTTGEIAERLGGTLRGEAGIEISGLAEAAEAGPGQITFAEEERFFERASEGGASAILVATPFECPGKALIQVENVRVGWAQLLSWFYPEPEYSAGIQTGATVASSAEIHSTAHVGPGCVIGAHVEIGPRVVLTGGVHVGEHCRIGEGAKLFPNVIIYPRTRIGDRVRIHAGTVVGSDGYGYVFDGAKHQKINQIGGVILEDDVELGANVTIDRGALGDTVIGEGSKIDNLVQIAHNVVVGKHCIIISQTGIAGSTKIGDYTIIAGQVGIAGHLKIGSRVTIAAQSGVMRDIPDGQKVFGSPAQGDRDFKRQLLGLQQLPDLIKRFRRLEAQSGRGAGED